MGLIWNRSTLGHTTTIGTHRIERLAGASNEDFQKAVNDAVTRAPLPPLNRVTNVTGQELLQEDGAKGDAGGAYLWSISFNGIHSPDAVRQKCEAMYEDVRAQIERVAKRSSFSVATLRGRWDAENEGDVS